MRWMRIPPLPGDTSFKASVEDADKDSALNLAMLCWRILRWALVALGSTLAASSTEAQTPAEPLSRNLSHFVAESDPPRHSTNLTNAVQWDNYTLFIDGQRLFLQYVSLPFPAVRR